MHFDSVLSSLDDNSLVLPKQQATDIPFDDMFAISDTAFDLNPLSVDRTAVFQTQLSRNLVQTARCKDSRTASSATDLLKAPPDSQPASSRKTTDTTCEFCHKVFSTVTNRNKHKNSACPKLPTPVFPCRYSDLGCGNVSTTKWNRDSHEKRWCSFNPNRDRKKMRMKANP